MVFDAAGPINNSLRFPDECVRHKILDMIGDLALAGCDLIGQLVAYRSGHRLNGELVRAVLADDLAEQTRQRRCARQRPNAPCKSQGAMAMSIRVADHVSLDPRAEIDDDVEIGPFCVIGPKTRIGRGTKLENSVTLMGNVSIGCRNHFYPGVVIGGEPQDVSYHGADTQVVVGDDNIIRECVTINRATEKEDGVTRVGDNNFLMGCCHIAHDCQLGDHIIIANGTLLGGHVHVHDHASLSGAVAVHHFATIGSYSFIGGLERGAARRAAVHARRGLSGPAPLHQRRRPEAEQLPLVGHSGVGRGPPAALPRQGRAGKRHGNPAKQRPIGAASQPSVEFRPRPTRGAARPRP